ncbi:redoxin domain-containing protein [Sphingobacterium olei]|uniref:Redoxin domain-containing protein n=1 Tax=Sphingobacterium olei TaxID=2571155 RepID=A0A4U0NZ98_9SPHI|nr:thioredoxin-like domain-containing protein [Sphingobacterium olei]TJZ60060.1 redoxin domain-containing protein [Sphingobacterium olei]
MRKLRKGECYALLRTIRAAIITTKRSLQRCAQRDDVATEELSERLSRHSAPRSDEGSSRRRRYNLSLIGMICFIVLFSEAQAQSAGEQAAANGLAVIKPLQIGDTIPEALWNLPLQVVNHPDGKDTITLNDYRDKKLIILDFWSSWCSSCINSFPSLDSIQNVFRDDLQILLVNPASSKDDRLRILYIMEQQGRGVTGSFAVPSIYNDKIITKYFQPKVYPRLIWLNEKGEVLAITGKKELNHGRLQQLLLKEGGDRYGN